MVICLLEEVLIHLSVVVLVLAAEEIGLSAEPEKDTTVEIVAALDIREDLIEKAGEVEKPADKTALYILNQSSQP